MEDFLTYAFLSLRERMKRRNASWTEDALQDAFVRLWGRYEPESVSQAKALLTTAAKHAEIDEKRRRKTVPLDGDVMEEESSVKEREELFLRVDDLIRTRLTDIQQYIIRRHQYEGASLEKVAKELGMKPPAVRMQLSRARKTIRELYGNERKNLL